MADLGIVQKCLCPHPANVSTKLEQEWRQRVTASGKRGTHIIQVRRGTSHERTARVDMDNIQSSAVRCFMLSSPKKYGI